MTVQLNISLYTKLGIAMIEDEMIKNGLKEEVQGKAELFDQGCFVCHGTGHWAREVKQTKTKTM